MAENGATKPQMSKTERTTLIRLVKQRFKLLESGLNARRHQIEAGIREEVRKEHEDKITELKDRYVVEIIEPIRELQNVLNRWHEDCRMEGLRYGNTGWVRDISQLRISDVVLEPADLNQEVSKRMADITGGKPLTRYALELEESKLVEELLVGDLSSDGAKEFMAKVPDVDKLLPLANSAAAIEIETGENI